MTARLLSAVLGMWLMAASAVLGYDSAARTNDRIVGPAVIAISLVALHEVARELRWLNAGLGLWLLAAPWVLNFPTAALVQSSVAGILLIALASLRGRIHHRFDGGWCYLWEGPGTSSGCGQGPQDGEKHGTDFAAI